MLVAQSFPTLYDPMDCGLPGSSVHGILQARILELVAIFLLHFSLEEGFIFSLLICKSSFMLRILCLISLLNTTTIEALLTCFHLTDSLQHGAAWLPS